MLKSQRTALILCNTNNTGDSTHNLCKRIEKSHKHKTYWNKKADTAFKWWQRNPNRLLKFKEADTKDRKENGAIQYFDADRNLLVSENATEPRLLNNGECYTFF